MKFLAISLVFYAILTYVVGGTTLEQCACWDGYRASMVGEEAMCVGIRLMAIKPCNIPQAPMCQCDYPGVTGVTTDDHGTRCSKYVRGVEVKSWPCGNQEEWESFKKQLANKPMDAY